MCGRLDIRPFGGGRWSTALAACITGDAIVTPAQQIPLITVEAVMMGRWGWPSHAGGLHVHARHEGAATKPLWAAAWKKGRAVVPVTGWWEGSWHVCAEEMYLAALWTPAADGPRAAILTQEPGIHAVRFERLPIPLSEAGAIEWLAGGDVKAQITDLHITAENRDGQHQTSIFDTDTTSS